MADEAHALLLHASNGHGVDDAVVTALVLAAPRLPAIDSPEVRSIEFPTGGVRASGEKRVARARRAGTSIHVRAGVVAGRGVGAYVRMESERRQLGCRRHDCFGPAGVIRRRVSERAVGRCGSTACRCGTSTATARSRFCGGELDVPALKTCVSRELRRLWAWWEVRWCPWPVAHGRSSGIDPGAQGDASRSAMSRTARPVPRRPPLTLERPTGVGLALRER
jgi:hypothetical protein